MKKFIFPVSLLALLLLVQGAFAQSDSTKADTTKYGWTHSLVTSLTLSQVAYTDWAAGGVNTLALGLIASGQSMDDEKKTNWTTNYKLNYGETKLADKAIRKTDDIIDILSVFTYKLDAYINPFFSGQFTSQFTTGYKYANDSADTKTPISNFLDPGYLTEAAGVGYQPIKELKLRLGLGLKEIFTNNYPDYAKDLSDPTKVQKTLVQGGLTFAGEAEVPIDSNLLVQSKLEVFAPFKTFDKMNVRFDNTISAKISKYVSAIFGFLLVEDPIVSTRAQIKEGLALGITYTVF
jgi:hypothetical protein